MHNFFFLKFQIDSSEKGNDSDVIKILPNLTFFCRFGKNFPN